MSRDLVASIRRVLFAGAAGLMLTAAGGAAQAAQPFEDLIGDYYGGVVYKPGSAQMIPVYGVNQPTGQGFTQSTRIFGGERDVQAHIVNSVGYPGDNDQAGAQVGLGIQNGFFFTSMGVGAGATASFLIQYDGVDGSMDLGPGLDVDLSQLGDRISLRTYANAVLHANPDASVATDLVVRLTDMSGRSASLSRSAPPSSYFTSLDYGFAAFEAANPLLDLRNIRAVELMTTISMQSYLDGGVSILDFGVGGYAYTPTNSISPAPEPTTWALLIAGFGLTGAALRRRRDVRVA